MNTAPELFKERPYLRGISHLIAFVVSLITGPILVVKASVPAQTVASIVFGVGLSLAMGVSALYHRVWWSPRSRAVMRKLDHSMIFVLVAATYTPLILIATHRQWRVHTIVAIWGLAVVGIAIRLAWSGIPRWALTLFYIAFGYLAVIVLPMAHDQVSETSFRLFVIGGLSYSVGACCYALKRPNPFPRFFGFHEIFHLFVIAGAACHYAAIYPLVAA
jgi:hemolysin III